MNLQRYHNKTEQPIVSESVEQLQHMLDEGKQQLATGDRKGGEETLWIVVRDAAERKECTKISAEALEILSHLPETVH